MKRILIALAATTMLSSPAFAAKIGVSMDKFDDNFLTVLRNGMSDYAKTQPGVTLQIEDAKDDVSKQLSQVQNFIANKRRRDHRQPGRHLARPPAITKAAADAGVPLVYVNRQPADVDKLGPKAAFVASNEERVRHARDPGDLQAARRQGQHSGDRGPALQPGRGAAHQGRPRRDRDRRLQAASRSSPSRPPTGIAPRRRT